MSRNDDRFRELCAAWVLGALDGEELREFEAQLKDATPQMLAMVRELQAAALHLPVGADPVSPPPAVKERILAAVRAGAASSAADRWTAIATGLGLDRPRFALSVTLALTLLVVALGSLSTVWYRVMLRQEQRVIALTDELERKQALLQVLQSKEVEFVRLRGLASNPDGYGKIIWDVENQVAVLQVTNLPPAPEDKVYQLWVYAKDRDPTSAGILPMKASTREAFFRFEGFTPVDKPAINGFLITLEPDGGAVQPSGEMYIGTRVDFSAP